MTNFFRDNRDLQFHFQHGIRWDSFVPLWEEGFRFADGPRSLAAARELYEASLAELGEYVHRSLPLVRMRGEIVRSGDRSTLEALQA